VGIISVGITFYLDRSNIYVHGRNDNRDPVDIVLKAMRQL
jgi:hypothetical protein